MANSKGKNTVSAVEELAAPIAESLGLRIWDVRYLKEGSQWYLRVFIDKDGGVDINDCENMSRAIDEPLDRLDPIDGEYILEVSSPGIERELIKPEHFLQFIGADIMVKMIRPIDGVGKEFKGVLTAFDDGMVTVTDHSGENTVTISKKDAAYIKLDDLMHADENYGKPDYFTPDGVHPNPNGAAFIAKHYLEAVKPLIDEIIAK